MSLFDGLPACGPEKPECYVVDRNAEIKGGPLTRDEAKDYIWGLHRDDLKIVRV